jgi:hypothetical protein
MWKLRALRRRRLITILSLIFVLALTTTTALAAKPRFSAAIVFTLSAPGTTSAQAALQGFAANRHDDTEHPIALVATGELSDLVDGREYELTISAKGKAEIVCGGGHYHGSSPKTVDVTVTGNAHLSPPYDHGNASFQVVAEEFKIDTKKACGSGYSNDYGRPRVTILSVLYNGGDVSLLEHQSHGKDKKMDKVQFSKCETDGDCVTCKQKGAG